MNLKDSILCEINRTNAANTEYWVFLNHKIIVEYLICSDKSSMRRKIKIHLRKKSNCENIRYGKEDFNQVG